MTNSRRSPEASAPASSIGASMAPVPSRLPPTVTYADEAARNVTRPSFSSKTPRLSGALAGSRMSLVGALPALLTPGLSQNRPATVSHPSSAFNSLTRRCRICVMTEAYERGRGRWLASDGTTRARATGSASATARRARRAVTSSLYGSAGCCATGPARRCCNRGGTHHRPEATREHDETDGRANQDIFVILSGRSVEVRQTAPDPLKRHPESACISRPKIRAAPMSGPPVIRDRAAVSAAIARPWGPIRR